jgi:5-methyltetrahydropteroyltriglutamate--homocysteine methyltransferase
MSITCRDDSPDATPSFAGPSMPATDGQAPAAGLGLQRHLYDYAVIRVVPRVDREEFVNVGIIVSCQASGYLAAQVALDEARLRAIDPHVDLDLVRDHLAAIPRICAGGEQGGPIGMLPPRARFHWLTARRSAIVQTSPVHTGRAVALDGVLDHLVRQLVRPPGLGPEPAAAPSEEERSMAPSHEGRPLFSACIAGSLPKPEWLAETGKLWPTWKAEGDALARAKADATLLWIKAQEDAGLDVIGDGEQSRQHFVHGFLERVDGIDFQNKVRMGIRNNRYDAMVPQVTGAIRLKGRVHETEARLLRQHTTRLTKFTLPGPMTIVDTVADRHYGDRVALAMAFAELLNQEARALEADGIDIIQFDEPAFNVYMAEAADWGVRALERAAEGLTCKTAVHICYGYGIQANIDWKTSLGEEWRQYETVFPALARSRIDQVSLECLHSHVPPDLMALLEGKEVMVGVIDVASDTIETAEEVADTIGLALRHVPRERLLACTNCGLAPMSREVAVAKLEALARGVALARERHR